MKSPCFKCFSINVSVDVIVLSASRLPLGTESIHRGEASHCPCPEADPRSREVTVLVNNHSCCLCISFPLCTGNWEVTSELRPSLYLRKDGTPGAHTWDFVREEGEEAKPCTVETHHSEFKELRVQHRSMLFTQFKK